MVINIMHNYSLLWNIIEYSQYDHLHHALLLLWPNIHESGLVFNILDMIIISMHCYQYFLSSIHYYAVLFKIINIIVMMHYCHYYGLFCISMHYYSRFSVLLSSLCMVINTMHNYLLLWNIIEYSQYDDLHDALL